MPLDRKGNWFAGRKLKTNAAVASAARTTTTTHTAFKTDGVYAIEATLAVTASSGTTPTLDVVVETTVDGTNWYTVGSFAQKTTTATEAKAFGPLGQSARFKATIAGTTPSFTYSIATKA